MRWRTPNDPSTGGRRSGSAHLRAGDPDPPRLGADPCRDCGRGLHRGGHAPPGVEQRNPLDHRAAGCLCVPRLGAGSRAGSWARGPAPRIARRADHAPLLRRGFLGRPGGGQRTRRGVDRSGGAAHQPRDRGGPGRLGAARGIEPAALGPGGVPVWGAQPHACRAPPGPGIPPRRRPDPSSAGLGVHRRRAARQQGRGAGRAGDRLRVDRLRAGGEPPRGSAEQRAARRQRVVPGQRGAGARSARRGRGPARGPARR